MSLPNTSGQELFGDLQPAVDAGVEALFGHHPERGGPEREQAVYAVLNAAIPSLRVFVLAEMGLEQEVKEGDWEIPRNCHWRETRYVTPWVHEDDPPLEEAFRRMREEDGQ